MDIGTVKTITLSKDHSRVLVDVQLTKEATDFAVKDTRFWVVRPRVGGKRRDRTVDAAVGRVYRRRRGQVDGRRRRTSSGSRRRPPSPATRKGHKFTLHGDSLGSIDIGSPVYYRRVQVGQVVGF